MSLSDDLIGIVMMGGNSHRMGLDKSSINYHGKPHAEYLFDLLQSLLPDCYVSVRRGQECDFTNKIIEDKYPIKGPMNGIMSGLNQNPEKAILVLAVDLPWMRDTTISKLIKERDSTKMATVYKTTKSAFPEPLIGIYEADALEKLEIFYQRVEKRSLRSFLQESDVKLVTPPNDLELFNVNTPEDLNFVKDSNIHH